MFENGRYNIFVQAMNFPRRRMILKQLPDRYQYLTTQELTNTKEWNILSSVREALYEPVEFWWTYGENTNGPFNHSLGIEVPVYYSGAVPMGFEIIELPPCMMLLFQGKLIDIEETDFYIKINEYDPTIYGFEWANDEAPRIRLVSIDYRGYIEARPVRLPSFNCYRPGRNEH